MRRCTWWGFWLVLLGASGLCPLLPAQPPATLPGQVVAFQFDRPGVDVPGYSILLTASGDGTYTESTPTENAAARNPGEPESGPRPIHVGPAVLRQVLLARQSLGTRPCETRQKNIANTGVKTFAFTGQGAAVSCSFNFSDSAALNEAATLLIGVAETLQTGQRLAAKHRFDRLGLDHEMETLDIEVKAGRALEVSNIAPVLRSIADDDRVIERVRRTAVRLLQTGEPSTEADARSAPGER